MKRNRILVALVAVLVLFLLVVTGSGLVNVSNDAQAAEAKFPSKGITVIVPFRPGGGFDLQARIIGPIWEKTLPNKVNIRINNQAGAGGKTGSLALMRSAADGYTVGILSPSNLAMMQVSNELENFNLRELTWLGQLSWDPGAVVVSAKSGIKTPGDLKNREIRFGVTSEAIFAVKLLAKTMGLNVRTVMFDGTAEEGLAAMRGDVDAIMDSWTAMKNVVSNSQGLVSPLFVVSDTRVDLWPDVKSSKDFGLKLQDLYPIAGAARLISAPKGIPDDVRTIMAESLEKATKNPQFKTDMEKAGYFASSGDASVAAMTVQTILDVLQKNKDLLK